MGSEESKSSPAGTDSTKDTPTCVSPGPSATALARSMSELLCLYDSRAKRLQEIIEALEKCQTNAQQIESNANAGRNAANVAGHVGTAAEFVPEEMAGDLDDALSAFGFLTGILAPVARWTVGQYQSIQTQSTHKTVQTLLVELKQIVSVLSENVQSVEGNLENHLEKLKNKPDGENATLFGLFELKSSLCDAKSSLNNVLRLRDVSVSESRERLEECREKFEKLKPQLQQFLGPK